MLVNPPLLPTDDGRGVLSKGDPLFEEKDTGLPMDRIEGLSFRNPVVISKGGRLKLNELDVAKVVTQTACFN